MEPGFFEAVRDAFEGFVAGVSGRRTISVHSRGLKVWFGDESREHYESQLIQLDGRQQLEIGFHAEHQKAPRNDEVLRRMLQTESQWREELGEEAVAGAFLGRAGWRRISELWPVPESQAIDDAIDTAARLADYVIVLEPIRRSAAAAD